MVPQDQVQERHSDSAARSEVINGLVAARRYEKTRPRLSPAAQEEMLQTGFPRLPEGDVVKEMTPEEFRRLRVLLRDEAGDRTAKVIVNLRQQLTEYHSLLDRLSSVSEKYAALEKKFEKRGSRIRSLEAEVSALRMERAQRSAPQVSGMGIQGHVAGDFLPMNQMLMQQQQPPPQKRQKQRQQMQDLPHPGTFQFRPDFSSFVNQIQAPNPIYSTDGPIRTSSHSTQSNRLQARQNVSPSPSAVYRQFPSEGHFHPGCGFPSNGQTILSRLGGPSPSPADPPLLFPSPGAPK